MTKNFNFSELKNEKKILTLDLNNTCNELSSKETNKNVYLFRGEIYFMYHRPKISYNIKRWSIDITFNLSSLINSKLQIFRSN